jgi:hypothetical protein
MSKYNTKNTVVVSQPTTATGNPVPASPKKHQHQAVAAMTSDKTDRSAKWKTRKHKVHPAANNQYIV